MFKGKSGRAQVTSPTAMSIRGIGDPLIRLDFFYY